MEDRIRFFLSLTALFLLFAGCTDSKVARKPGSTSKPSMPVKVDQSKLTERGFEQLDNSLFRRPLGSASSGTSQFSIVSGSGIDFANNFSRETPYRLIETGAGVAIGDYNNDGHADVYMLGTDGPNKLFRGLGNFKFEDATDEAGVDGSVLGKDVWAAGASFADVDNDGHLDLMVCNMGAKDLLDINRGDGTFREEANLRGVGHADASKIGSFCDYDLDGDLDLYLLTYKAAENQGPPKIVAVDGNEYIHPDSRDSYGIVHGRVMESGQRDYLFQNDGNGYFTDVTQESQLMDHALGLGISWVDYDDDGHPDIYVSNDFWQPDRLFRNLGDGTFTDVLPQMARHAPWFAMGNDSGDLNNDGLIDLIVGEMSGTTHFRQKLNMGSMEESAWFLELGTPRQYMRNAVYINSGANQFMEAAFMTGLSSTNWTWAIRLVDLDNDGLLDVFATNGHARDSMNADIVNELTRLQKEGNMEAVYKANQDVPPLREKNLAFRNQGNFQFNNVSEAWGLDHEGISHGVAMADFDSDGDLDMVVNNLYEPATVYRNDSSDGNRITLSLRNEQGNFFGYGTKVQIRYSDQTQTKYLTPVRGYLSSDQPIIHFGVGQASTIEKLTITWPGGVQQSFENLETGFHYLAVNREKPSPQQTVESQKLRTAFSEPTKKLIDFTHFDGQHDDFARQPLLPYRTSRLGPGVAVGDINKDGLPDLFLCNGNDQPSVMMVNRGGTEFEKVKGPWRQHFVQDDMSALFFDANGDGLQDLLVTSGGSEYKAGSKQLQDRIYINRGQETFEYSPEALPETAVSSGASAAFDFDHDGDLDLLIGSRSTPHQYPKAPPSRLLENEGGRFTETNAEATAPLSSLGIVNSILCSDFNSDGWTDVIVATEWGPVRFIENSEGVLKDVTEELGVDVHSGWWHGLAAGDFDNDGDLDYVATNLGLNTKYHADKKHPHRLYYGDFDDSGRVDLVEAKYEKDTEYPVRGLSCSSRAIPMVGEKFDKFQSFAMAPLAEIYDMGKTEHDVKEANYFESAIFWNESGKIRIEALPRMAQISPGYGIETLDFDCDGDIDILIANNFFGAEPETGLMDGGLGALLQNDGNGKFDFVWPNRSGVLLESDSMGMGLADIDEDGDLDAVVGVHSGRTRLLLNESNPLNPRKLELVAAAAGNQNAVGASILVSRKGDKQRHEIRAGGSYLSQSANQIYLYPGDENPIQTIDITWPSGKRTTLSSNEFDSAEKTLRLVQENPGNE